MLGRNIPPHSFEEDKHFLEDRPLQKLNEDKFQYTQVAEILYELLNQNNFPTHIGLFAPWGSGKTSVIRLLEDIINADESKGDKYILKTISVWKFADDAPSLHRKIVREVQSELGVLDDEGLKSESTHQESLMATGLFSLLSLLKKPYRLVTSLYLFILISVIVTAILLENITFNTIVGNLLPLATILVILKFFLGPFQRGSHVIVKTIPLAHGDQYEARFKESVHNFLRKNNGKNLILVFDDLDRLPPKQLLAALNTIKTFLHSKNCAFIIPCDESVLRNGIKTAFEKKEIIDEELKNNDNYVSEFINKTFDYQIHLPILEQKNMKRYAKQLLLDQKISLAVKKEMNVDKLLGVLIHSSIKTPRQVKTLLNSFSANWELAKKRDLESGIKLLSADPLALAVFTVLQTDFPDYYLKLISNPFLINTSEGRDEKIEAYLSRVDKCIPKTDPRPFIYFSNEKLNPATGKPELSKIKDYLLNAQVEQFRSSYNNLSEYDRETLLSSVISDFDDNPGIEVENSIATLIQADVDLSVISEMDLHSWDLLLKDNIDTLTEYIPSKVCRLLNYLTDDNLSTWHSYGLKLNINNFYDDILGIWIESPNIITKIGITNLGEQIVEAYLEQNDGYSLTSKLYEIEKGHSILNSIDWIKGFKESLDSNVIPDFTLSSWLQEWSNKTSNKISTSLIIDLLKAFNFRDKKYLQDVGKLWIENFKHGDEELIELIYLLKNEFFNGFTNNDFVKVNNFMANATYTIIRDTVKPLLDEWWEDDKVEQVTNFLETFPDCPGIPGFCETRFDFDLDADVLAIFIKNIIQHEGHLNNIPNILKKIELEVSNAAANQRESKAGEIIKRLIKTPNLGQIIKERKSSIIPVIDKNVWLSLGPEVVKDRLDIFFALWQDDETAQLWIMECIEWYVNSVRGNISLGGPYIGQATQYISLFTEGVSEHYSHLDWETTLDNWMSIKAINGYNTFYDLFTVIDSAAKTKIIGTLHRRCKFDNDSYNQLLVKYYESAVSVHREAVYDRWEVIGPTHRKTILESLLNETKETRDKSIELLAKQLKDNPLPIFLDEIVDGNLQEDVRKSLFSILIDELSYVEVSEWVNSSMNDMNQNGYQMWKSYVINRAISIKKVDIHEALDIIEVSLGLGSERAKIALELILASDLNKVELKKLREKIINLYEDFPVLVDRFGFRFKVRT